MAPEPAGGFAGLFERARSSPAILAACSGALAATAVCLALRRRRRFSWRSAHALKDGSAVILRSGCQEDIPTLYKQLRDLAVLHDELDELRTTEKEVSTAFADGAFHVLLVEVNGKVVGSATFQDSYRTWTGPSLYLQDLIIDAQYRGRGLGTLTMQVLAAVALARACNRMFWESHAGNAKANAFYASDAIRGASVRGEHQLLTWKLVGEQNLRACAERAGVLS